MSRPASIFEGPLAAGLTLGRDGDLWRATFTAMACPCEVLVESAEADVAVRAANAVATEAWRVERKFSRYRDDNIVHVINNANGADIEVDEETARLLAFAGDCYQVSQGLFDVTSGVLRRVWKFDGSDRLPEPGAVRAVMQYVGWRKVSWHAPYLRLQPGMEIDFGGIGKEYAVDRALQLADGATGGVPLLVNFGGDVAALKPRHDGRAWKVAIEKLKREDIPPVIELRRGGVTTSGDANRYLLKDGVRYSHILDPRTGWPVKDAPHSVTVLEANCTQAGMLSTLAMLQGRAAERFLKKQGVTHWIIR